MSKKNKGNDHYENNIFSNLSKVLSDMTAEEREMLQMLFQNPNEVLNARFYRYDAPNYHSKPIAKWLNPLLHVSGYWDILDACEEAIDRGKKLSKEQQRDDIKNMFYSFFEEFEPADEIEMEEEEDDGLRKGNMSLIAAMQLMELLDIDGCEDVVIESLRQDAYFWSYYTEGGEEYITYSLFREPSANRQGKSHEVCQEKIDLLLDFMKEIGRIPQVKPIVFDTIVMIYLHCPKKRLKASAAIVSYLNYCYKICKEGADTQNIDTYAYSLATAHIKESLPILKKMYKELDIPQIETTGFDDIKEMMDDETVKFRYEHTTIKQLIEETLAGDDEDEWDNEIDPDDEDDFDDDDIEDALGLEYLYDPAYTPKKYTLRVAMIDALEPVERTFTVPSTMYLNHLANIIMIAFGHENMPEEYYCFTDKDEVVYSSIGTCIDDYETTEMTEDTLIQDVLEKKNSSILLSLVRDEEYDWEISVVLESPNGRYKDVSNLGVKLTSGYGAFPPESCETMKEYEELFTQKKLKKPDFKKVQKNIDKYLASKQLPF